MQTYTNIVMAIKIHYPVLKSKEETKVFKERFVLVVIW